MAPIPGRGDRRGVLAACAVALATAVGSHAAAGPSEVGAIQQLERYCAASWRNAGIRRDEWDDYTQQALLELLESVSTDGLPVAIADAGSPERRELNRAVWRLVQRWRRAPRSRSLDERRVAARHEAPPDQPAPWEELLAAARGVVSPRQLAILELMGEGWRVAEIADRLGMPPSRVSDEKYKALSRIRALVS
jgi:DNA-directed RNA polymerase specialized sigma24 family protein